MQSCAHLIIIKTVIRKSNLLGAQAGNVIALPLGGLLADEVSWESAFYVFGILGCIWFVFWVFLVFDSPDTHPRISKEERDYIVTNLYVAETHEKLPRPPFKYILVSPAFLAILAAHFGQNWGSYTMLTEIPTYLTNIQHFSLTAVSYNFHVYQNKLYTTQQTRRKSLQKLRHLIKLRN